MSFCHLFLYIKRIVKEESKLRNNKLYNIIFPIWAFWIFPPLIIIALIGNYFIDSIVICLCYHIFKVGKITGRSGLDFYKKSIIKVWLLGFLADFLGVIPLLLVFVFDIFSVPDEITRAVMYTSLYNNSWAFISVIACMILTSILIYLLNYYIGLKKIVENRVARIKVSLTIAVITCPWVYLMPTNWFYK